MKFLNLEVPVLSGSLLQTNNGLSSFLFRCTHAFV